MPKEEIQEQAEESSIEPSGAVYPDDLKGQVLDFSQKIINLTQNYNVGRLTLDEPLLTKTLDWTATGPTKRDFIGVYSSEEGLRFKQLKRTQRNNALGLCPNW